MRWTAVRIDIRIEISLLIIVPPSPHAPWSSFDLARQVIFSLMLLTPLIRPTPVLFSFRTAQVLYDMRDSFAVVVFDVVAVVPHHRPGLRLA